MKKLLGIVVLGLILFVTQTNKSFAMEFGHGELKLSNKVVKAFIKYIKGKKKNSPYLFAVAIDGLEYQYWICPAGVSKCVGENATLVIKDCEKYSRKYGSGAKCAVFGHNRHIKWDNGINKNTKINSKWSDAEIKAKLTELGFYGNTTTAKKKETKKLIDIEFPEALKPFNEKKTESWKEYMSYKNDTQWPYGAWVEIRTKDGYYNYGWASDKNLKLALKIAKKSCEEGKKKNKTIFTNSEICIVYSINGVETTNEEKIKYAEKFYKKKASESFEKNPWILKKPKITKKIEKKKEEKVVKKYSLEGERSLALSWEGYSDLIAGTVKFDEADYKGTLNLALPNNDGTCEGSYSLQADGKGTWQISCTNNMGAAGTLKWIEDGGVTGIGRDYSDKKVKFTVSKQS